MAACDHIKDAVQDLSNFQDNTFKSHDHCRPERKRELVIWNTTTWSYQRILAPGDLGNILSFLHCRQTTGISSLLVPWVSLYLRDCRGSNILPHSKWVQSDGQYITCLSRKAQALSNVYIIRTLPTSSLICFFLHPLSW